MRAHWGTRVPEGIGLGKLGKVSGSGDSLSQRSTHAEGGIIFAQLDEYSDQLIADKPRENRREEVVEHTYSTILAGKRRTHLEANI
jgi:hypothetical protein